MNIWFNSPDWFYPTSSLCLQSMVTAWFTVRVLIFIIIGLHKYSSLWQLAQRDSHKHYLWSTFLCR